jgi:predicted alpha-1,6-mannanase (GH76 family)
MRRTHSFELMMQDIPMRLEHKPLSLILVLSLTLSSAFSRNIQGQTPVPSMQTPHAQRVQTIAQVLATSYDPATGLFRDTGWWNSANGISALTNASRTLHSKAFNSIFVNTFDVAQRRFPGFLNEFYDDEGWWALAWLDVYELQGTPRYLSMAESIFADMTGGWSDTCGGGIWWKKNEHYKNAIANELFLSVAVRLALLNQGENRAGYLDWAQKQERWFLSSGMLNEHSLINDGLDASCQNNRRATWSYNQGVILTGLVGFYKLTHDKVALQKANQIAAAVAAQLTDAHGVLHDPCEPNCGADGVQFKGILVRNLAPLLKTAPSSMLSHLLQRNADALWNRARTDTNRFSVNWSGPPQDSGTGSLISALDALTAEIYVRTQSPRVLP